MTCGEMKIKLQKILLKENTYKMQNIKFPVKKQLTNTTISKKVFTRKQCNTPQNTSRFLYNRLKTQNDQKGLEISQNQPEQRENQTLRAVKNIKFFTTNASKSVQKLITNHSMQNLRNFKKSTEKQIDSNQNLFNLNNNSKLLIDQPTIKRSFTKQNLSIIIDQNAHCPEIQFGSNKYSKNDRQSYLSTCEESLTSSRKLILNKNDICQQSQLKKSLEMEHQNCTKCLKELKALNQKNQNLLKILDLKDKQIKTLKQSLNEYQSLKKNYEYELKLVKEKQILISSQKEEMELAYKKLHQNYSKVSQDLKYKDLQNNINKRYRKECQQLESKVSRLKQELQFCKAKVKGLQNSQSLSSLKISQPALQIGLNKKQIICNFCRTKIYPSTVGYQNLAIDGNEKKGAKSPKICKVYSQDSVFSLSSQYSDY